MTMANEWRNKLARPEQLMPGTRGSSQPTNVGWWQWEIIGGRSSGKTRAAAEAIAELIAAAEKSGTTLRVGLVSTTRGAIKREMIEPHLLNALDRVSRYNAGDCKITTSGGSTIEGCPACVEDVLRGRSFHVVWCDKSEEWPHSETRVGVEIAARLESPILAGCPRAFWTLDSKGPGIATTIMGES